MICKNVVNIKSKQFAFDILKKLKIYFQLFLFCKIKKHTYYTQKTKRQVQICIKTFKIL